MSSTPPPGPSPVAGASLEEPVASGEVAAPLVGVAVEPATTEAAGSGVQQSASAGAAAVTAAQELEEQADDDAAARALDAEAHEAAARALEATAAREEQERATRKREEQAAREAAQARQAAAEAAQRAAREAAEHEAELRAAAERDAELREAAEREDELRAEQQAGTLSADDPRIDRGRMLAIGADISFGLSALFAGLTTYFFLHDAGPDSEGTVLEPRDWAFAPIIDPSTGTASFHVGRSF